MSERRFMNETDDTVESAINLADTVHHRILLPFVDVQCLFVADIGGVDTTVRRLATWAAVPVRSTTADIRPVLVLVVTRGQVKKMKAALNALPEFDKRTSALGKHFRQVRIIVFNPTRRTNRKNGKQQRVLRRALIQSINSVHRERNQLGLLFSAFHTAHLLQAAAERAVASPWTPLNFIATARKYNSVAVHMDAHLMNFLEQFRDNDSLQRLAIPLVASAILLDQYPPGMHPFHPRDVFKILYRDACAKAHRDLTGFRVSMDLPDPPNDFTALLEAEFDRQYHAKQLVPSKTWHNRQLLKLCQSWTINSSEETCFACLRRRPQYCLPCQHWVCQNCVRVFCHLSDQDPWLFNVEKCLLCDALFDNVHIRVKPDTASPRVLSIDGGGTRGRAPLEFLRILQQAIALPYPIQRNFDIVFGTSSGAMSACALCINGWPVEKCITYFETAAAMAFEQRRTSRLLQSMLGNVPVLLPLTQFVISLLGDSKYSAERLERIQQDVYGPIRSIFDSNQAKEMGTLLGLTLTSVVDSSAFIVTNYIGASDYSENRSMSEIESPVDHYESCPRLTIIDYQVLQAEDGMCRVPLWQILARSYFTPYHIDGAGTFQDGGLTLFNNPASIALKEAADCFPLTPNPSVVLSLGTGSVVCPEDQQSEAAATSWWRDSFPCRLFRAFWKQGDSNVTWNQVLEQPKAVEDKNLFRFNVEFEGKQPPLDDVDGMTEVARAARKTASESCALKDLEKRQRAELFVFELDASQPPRITDGVYECVGHIMCRLRASTVEYATFVQQLNRGQAIVKCHGQIIKGSFFSASEMTNVNYNQEVKFQVPSRQTPFQITLEEQSSSPWDISGSPFTIDALSEQQGLHACFGSVDHRKRSQIDFAQPEPKKQRRVHGSNISPRREHHQTAL
ncbi:LOW QUALITY PROTEIN: Phospholipase A1 [Paramyrothecium foliicola]|nr:LOW QUALITY PROTEIN: Phospholipase A1 [Paramyrothecium foliicola]